jgi:DNA-nicking Smr family endonuclease
MRKLTEQERKLWKDANRDTKPLQKQEVIFAVSSSSPVAAKPVKTVVKPLARPFIVERKKKIFVPDITIDLHGYTIHQAYTVFLEFIKDSYYQKYKNTLVVTGHGDGETSIQKEFTIWVKHPSIKDMITSCQQAAPRHGGSGAFYVILKVKS